MKTTTILLLAAFAIASCTKKEKKSCYTCTSKITILSPAHDSTSVVKYCDKTKEEISAIQTAGSTSTAAYYSYTICKQD